MSAPRVPGSKRGRVALVTTSYPTHPGDPSGHFVAAEAHALARAGHPVTVLVPSVARARAPGVEQRDGVEVRWLPAGDAFGPPGAWLRLRERPLRAFGAVRFVRTAQRELARLSEVERVIAHFLVPSGWPIATTATQGPLELVVHGSDLGVVEALPAPLRRRLAQSLRAASIRCVSAELRERLGRALGASLAERARVEPSPLELDAVPDRGDARRTLGLAADARVVVVVGRLVRGKRCDLALRAATLVPGAHLVVVGDGPERTRLEREFPEAHFTGTLPRPRALAWLSAADVLVSASEREGAPSVVREARALGTRVVALPAGDLHAWGRTDSGLTVLAVSE
jgi:teichuronic acid biosynthesis glycosyltransferase TuaC